MAKCILVVAVLAPMLLLTKPAPAGAHVGLGLVLGLPFLGFVIAAMSPGYGPPGYAPPGV
ncbi:MAG: hypothetical protein H6Q33_790 [Deltaproteobacteria bacterium]|nr:hypothetical protein [Deltaproteobacteria bacterium]